MEVKFTNDIYDILNDYEISFVIDACEETEEANDFIMKAARGGKSVATANKYLVAEHMDDFLNFSKDGSLQALTIYLGSSASKQHWVIYFVTFERKSHPGRITSVSEQVQLEASSLTEV